MGLSDSLSLAIKNCRIERLHPSCRYGIPTVFPLMTLMKANITSAVPWCFLGLYGTLKEISKGSYNLAIKGRINEVVI